MSDKEQSTEFASVKARLAEIADIVDDESISLDQALDLYEEAVALGLQASDLLETGIVPPEDDALEHVDQVDSSEQTAPSSAPVADDRA